MANNQTNTARLLCSFFITVCLYTQNIKIKSTLQSTGKAVRQMWVRRFQLGWSLQAHDQWFPVGSCAALRRRRGAFWWGWGGRAKCQGSGRDGTGGSFGLRHKKNRWLEIVTHYWVVRGGWGRHHHRHACATQRAGTSWGTSEAHLTAFTNEAWQGLAGAGAQLREEGGEEGEWALPLFQGQL